MEVANGGYIRAEDGGDGADLVDFAAAGVAGLIEADGSSNDGINNSVSKTNSSLALTVSSTGTIYGGLTGVYSTQVDLINNAGTIQGGGSAGSGSAGIFEANTGNDLLVNSATGKIIGGDYGLYDSPPSTVSSVKETLYNSGLIQGSNSYGIGLNYAGGTAVTNYNGGQIIGGSDGIYDGYSVGPQSITNAGLIQGNNFAGIFLLNAAGQTDVLNDSNATIEGRFGLAVWADLSGPTTITNRGLISGINGAGIFFLNDVMNATIINSKAGEIVGTYDTNELTGAVNLNIKGNVTISNAGTIIGRNSSPDIMSAAGVSVSGAGNSNIDNTATAAYPFDSGSAICCV